MFEGSKLNSMFTAQDIDVLNTVFKNGGKFNSELSRSLKMQTSLITALGESYKKANKYLNENLKGHLTMLSVKQKELENIKTSANLELSRLRQQKLKTQDLSKQEKIEEKINNLQSKTSITVKSLESQIQSRNNNIQRMHDNAKKPTVGTVIKTNLLSKIPALSETVDLMDAVKGLDLPGIFGPIIAILEVLAKALKGVVDQIINGIKGFRDFGFTASQIGSLVAPTTNILKNLASNGVFASAEEVAHSIGQISADIGRAATGTKVGELVDTSLTLQKIWSVNEGIANRFTIALYRISGGNTKYVESVRQLVGEFSKAHGISAQTVIQGMADNMEAFYQSTDKSVGSFAQLILDAKNLGVSVSTIAQLQDSLGTDFEGMIESQAQIQAFQPEISLGPAAIYSQYGSPDEVLRAIKTEIDKIPKNVFDSMPYAERNILAKGFHISQEDLVNIRNGGDLSKIAEGQKPEAEQITDKLDNLKTSGLDLIVGRLDASTIILGEIASSAKYLASYFGNKPYDEKTMGTTNKLMRTNPDEYKKRLIEEAHDARMLSPETSVIAKWFDKLGFSDRTKDVATADKWMQQQTQASIGGLQSQMITVKTHGQHITGNTPDFSKLQLRSIEPQTQSRAIGGMVGDLSGASHSLSSVLRGLSSNEIFSVLHKGETVLTALQTEKLGSTLDSIANLNSNTSEITPTTGPVANNMNRVESLLGELVSLMKAGGIAVHLDGKKVSAGLIAANRQGY